MKPGARESNAGDDFHILWASRRAVQMLNPRSTLQVVRMEGVSPVELTPPDDDDPFLGVDLTEYFGGDQFATATQVDVSQLKYSTRHPDRAWTAARLAEHKAKGDASVLERLERAFHALYQEFGRSAVLGRLRVRLVSNQPASDDLLDAVQAAQAFLSNHMGTTPLTTAALKKGLAKGNSDVIARLKKASVLGSRVFTDFLRVLDLSDCGVDNRSFQRLKAIEELGLTVSWDPVGALRNLHDIIKHEALPERKGSLGLTRADLLACLEAPGEDALFPVPPSFTALDNPIPTQDADTLAKSVSVGGNRILAHGPAGVGKTTTLRALESQLGPGSVVIPFDCYGDGAYLRAGEERHLPSRALLQLINDIAVRCGTPFLVRPPREGADLWRHFTKVVQAASKIVADQDGLFVIAIDAADNAMVASRIRGDTCFVSDLWEISLPDNARIVMTARSHRRGDLKAPPTVVETELLGFDSAASGIHLRHVYLSADETDGETFHNRTQGNPRVQYYLLERAKAEGQPLEELLNNSAHTPDGLFDDLVTAAVEHVAEPETAKKCMATMVCMTRPATVGVFTQVLGLSDQQAQDFCRALAPGVMLTGDEMSFRDEDFETYVRGRLTVEQERDAHDRLATYLLAFEAEDAYAAQAVAEHLFLAERYDDLLHLVTEGQEPFAVQDELARVRVWRRRITLAMQSATKRGDDLIALRLTLLAAVAVRSDTALKTLIRDQPDLAALYGDVEAVSKLYLEEGSDNWQGAAHLRIACMLARDASHRVEVGKHLRLAEAWIRRWINLPDLQRRSWRLDATDIACGAEAIYWLHGAEATAKWLRRWRPAEVVLTAVDHLAGALAGKINPIELQSQLESMRAPVWVEAVFLGALWRSGSKPADAWVESITQRIEAALSKREWRPKKLEWIVDLCELAAFCRQDPNRIRAIGNALGAALPDYAPHEYEDCWQYDGALRMRCLLANLSGTSLTAEDLLPERLREKPNRARSGYDEHESERRQFRELFAKILDAYELRACIITDPNSSNAEPIVVRRLKKFEDESSHRWFKFDRQFRTWARTTIFALTVWAGDASGAINRICDLAERAIKLAAPNLWVDIAQILLEHGKYPNMALLLLDRAARFVQEHPYPGSDRWQLLLRCASVAELNDSELCRVFFRQALKAAEGIDDDSVMLLRLHAQMAERSACVVSTKYAQSRAERLSRLLEAHVDYVSSPSDLPWQETLIAITRLDVPTGFAVSSRWDDEARLGIHDGILCVAKPAVECGQIPPLGALSLLRLAGEQYDVSQDALDVLEPLVRSGGAGRSQLAHGLRMLASWIQTDVPISHRSQAAKRVLEWTSLHRLTGISGTTELRQLVSWAETNLSPGVEEDISRRKFANDSQRREQFLADARGGHLVDAESRLRTLCENSPGDSLVREYLTTLGRSVSPSQRTAFLDILVSLPTQDSPVRWYMGSIGSAIVELLTEWKYFPQISQWAPDGFARFLQVHLMAVLTYKQDRTDVLEGLLGTTLLSNHQKVQALLKVVYSHLDHLTVTNLYAVSKCMALILPAESLSDVLDWSMDRLERHFPSLNSSSLLSQQSTVPEAIAGFFWALLGHPDKRVRWRALHAARSYAYLGDPQFLTNIVGLSDSTEAGAYRSSSLEFYWLSARVWLCLLLSRIADERPTLLKNHANRLAELALSTSLPHVQARDFAKRATLSVTAAFPGLLGPELLDQVTRVNIPRSCFVNRENRYEARGEHVREEDFRFKFDTTDTIPYWYNPLGDVFRVSGFQIAKQAEVWICDRWGRTTEDWWKDERELRDERAYRFMDNSHGSVPRIENLKTYLEYHAMFCVAGQSIDRCPISVETYENATCRWQEWLLGHLNASPHWWFSDLRCPTPLESYLWGKYPPLEQWLVVRDDDFDEALGLGRKPEGDCFVAHAHIDLHAQDRRSDIRVTTALVSPTTADALLRALSSAEGPTDYCLPLEDETYSGDVVITEPGFELLGWTRHIRIESNIDEHDPLVRGLYFSFTTIGDDFIRRMSLSPDHRGLTFSRPDGSQACRLEIWSDDPKRDYVSEPYSLGERLWVRLDLLLEYLRIRAMDLAIEVHISRSRSKEDGEGGNSYDPGRKRIYLLRRDGTLQVVGGMRSLR